MAKVKVKVRRTRAVRNVAPPVDVEKTKRQLTNRTKIKPDGKARDRVAEQDGFTLEKRHAFLAHYQTGLTVREAAKKVGVSSVTVFNYVRRNEAFADAYHIAMESNTDVLEDGLHDLARNGNIAAIFGTLKARRPERWRDRVDLSNADGSILKPLAEAIKRAHGIGGGDAK